MKEDGKQKVALNEWKRKKALNCTPNPIIRIFGFAFRKS
jgi:hypothetical protein